MQQASQYIRIEHQDRLSDSASSCLTKSLIIRLITQDIRDLCEVEQVQTSSRHPSSYFFKMIFIGGIEGDYNQKHDETQKLIKLQILQLYSQHSQGLDQMSLFLLQQEQFQHHLLSSESFQKYQTHNFPRINSKSLKQLEKRHVRDINRDSFTNKGGGICEKAVVEVAKFAGYLQGLLLVNPHSDGCRVSLSLKLLAPMGSYYKIDNKSSLIQTCRKAVQYHSQNKSLGIRACIHGDTREIKIHLPDIFTSSSSQFFKTYHIYKQNDTNWIKRFFRSQYQILNHLIKQIVKNEVKWTQPNLCLTQERKQLMLIHKFNEMSSATCNLSIHEQMEKGKSIEIKKEVLESTKALLSRQSQVSQYLLKSNQNYVCSIQSNWFEEKGLSESEFALIKRQIAFPETSGSQTMTLLNNILIKSGEQIHLEKINEGGFSNIFKAEIKFWVVQSQDITARHKPHRLFQQKNDHLIQKEMVIKRELPVDFKRCQKQIPSKIQHEIQIIKKMKNETPLFIPKYFIPKNKIKVLSNSLLMDYFESKTLDEFIQAFGKSVSLMTKLFIMFSAVQAMRQLKQNNVVHLDLKPSNIFTHQQMMIKIIDFGQSYHPRIEMSKFQPGFTVPYSCPELFSNSKTFTSKADVFSLGVILYQILYNKNPFSAFTRTTHLPTVLDNYQELWFMSPEQAQTFGQSEVFDILNSLISKCLSRAPEERPELDWMCIIIRQLIDLVF